MHARGSIREPADHIEEATGQQLRSDAFVAYLADKIGALYGVSA